MQSAIRGFLSRIHHRRELQRAKDENLREIQKWSILILQKVARGYIARKTIVRSMKIRKHLSRDVLRIAEKFMTSGDVWGFLDDINEELVRAKKELKDSETREDNWASKFVEKVVKNREEEFNDAWDRFPAAVQSLKQTNTVVGSLIDDHKDLSKPSKKTSIDHKGNTQEAAAKSSLVTSMGKESSANHKVKSGNSKEISEEEVVAAMNFTVDTHYSSNPDRIPGPLLRKALQTTVKVEVASQLNKIMQSSFHSRKLTQDIISVYGPESRTNKPSGKRGSTSSGPVKKQRTALDGKVTKQVGKVSANGADWLSSQNKVLSENSQDNTSENEMESKVTGLSRLTEVQPGNTLLLDVPLGLEDSIERLLHAAALRCYIPDFFRGSTESLLKQQEAQWQESERKRRRSKRFQNAKRRLMNEGYVDQANSLQLDDPQFNSDDGDEQNPRNDEDEYDVLGDSPAEEDIERQYRNKQHRNQRFVKQFAQSKNLDPNYAYRVYLSLPLGLAKLRYENECKRWAQPYINQLRIKGLHLLRDVLPVSKFMSCLVNVQTPRSLRNKGIDLCLDLKHMGSAAWGNHTAPSIPSNIKQDSKDASATGHLNSGQIRSRSPNAVPSTHQKRGNVTFQDEVSVHSVPIESIVPTQNVDGSFRANLDRIEDVDGTMRQLAQRNTILAKQAAEVARETEVQSQAKTLLQSILENPEADWCQLNAGIDDFFIQAAFLIVPHMHHHPTTEKIPPAERNSHILMMVATMGNEAFKAYAMELYTLQDSNDREDFVRARFRSAVILTTPFTLYLKNRGVATVQDLLKVNLQDLSMPAALLYQLEVLITIVVGRQVRAKILPTSTKSHSEEVRKTQKANVPNKIQLERTFASSGNTASGAEFAVPLLYDTRFQRTPLDPFGRPPILATTTKKSGGKKKMKQSDAAKHLLSQSLTQFDTVASQAALESDMEQASGLFLSSEVAHKMIPHQAMEMGRVAHEKLGGLSSTWDSSHLLARHPPVSSVGSDSLQLPGFVVPVDEDGSSVASSVIAQCSHPMQDTFSNLNLHTLSSHLPSPNNRHLSSLPLKVEMNSSRRLWHMGDVPSEIAQGKQNDVDPDQVVTEKPMPSKGSEKGQQMTAAKTSLPDIHLLSPSAERKPSSGADGKRKNAKNYVELNRSVRPVDCFKDTFRCHHPGCNQVFSRNYTYKVHLKTHEIFPQYHEYKSNPQLFLDQLL